MPGVTALSTLMSTNAYEPASRLALLKKRSLTPRKTPPPSNRFPVTTSELASAWGSRFVLYRNAGHINAESGFGPWPQGLTHVQELAHRAAHGHSSELTARPLTN